MLSDCDLHGTPAMCAQIPPGLTLCPCLDDAKGLDSK